MSSRPSPEERMLELEADIRNIVSDPPTMVE